ncbi:ABC transporter permease [Trichothermofontia sp.]
MSLSPRNLLITTLQALASNWVRSGLTTLGVFMGVASVQATLQVSTISQAVIAQKLAEREAPQVYIWPDFSWNTTSLKWEDLLYLKQRLKGLQAISVEKTVDYEAPTLVADKEAQPIVSAVSPGYFLTTGKNPIRGRVFTEADFNSYQPIVVIDELLATQLGIFHDPIDQRLLIRGKPYIVVGVVETKQRAFGKPKGDVYMTLAFYQSYQNDNTIWDFSLRPRSLDEIEDLATQAKQLLEQRYPGQTFVARNNLREIVQQRQILIQVSRALLVLGLISLLVGGIGIANITIATVGERTAEIGLRLAIGATRRDILVQFVLEAVLLSLVGGALAIVSVHGLTTIVARSFELPYRFHQASALFSMSAALLVGVGSSYFPALRASRLDPVAALRNE